MKNPPSENGLKGENSSWKMVKMLRTPRTTHEICAHYSIYMVEKDYVPKKLIEKQWKRTLWQVIKA